MAAFELVWTCTFERTLRRYLGRHPELAGLVGDVLGQLELDPASPRLRLHPLHGRHQGKHAVRLTHTDRVVLILRWCEHEIVLLDIGSHGEVYR